MIPRPFPAKPSPSPDRPLRTSELARAAGIHPNTVRLYELWGLIPPVERSPSNYRRFTQRHLDCLLLARRVYGGGYPGMHIRRAGVKIIQHAVAGDLGGSLELAYQYMVLVQSERAMAEAAAALLERWAQGTPSDSTRQVLSTHQAAKLLGVSIDMLRNWERNGLLDVPRNPENGYRQYGAAELSRLRVIRMLSRAGYSLMAILRMLIRLDAGQTEGLGEVLDTPRPDEDVFSASDRWLSTLDEHVVRAGEIITQLEEMIQKESG